MRMPSAAVCAFVALSVLAGCGGRLAPGDDAPSNGVSGTRDPNGGSTDAPPPKTSAPPATPSDAPPPKPEERGCPNGRLDIRGTVVWDDTSAPATSATVGIDDGGLDWLAITQTGTDGRFALSLSGSDVGGTVSLQAFDATGLEGSAVKSVVVTSCTLDAGVIRLVRR